MTPRQQLAAIAGLFAGAWALLIGFVAILIEIASWLSWLTSFGGLFGHG